MIEQGVCHAEVAFGIFKIDRIDLVRHSRRANLVLCDLLLEIAQRDVSPEVPTQVDQDRVVAHERMRVLGRPVMGFDLRCVGIRVKAE